MSRLTRRPARRGRIERWFCVALCMAVTCGPLAPAAWAQAPFRRIAKTGDPVPGMPGFTWDSVGLPAIDANGHVVLRGFMDGPGITTLDDTAIFHGRPGGLSMVVREGQPFPEYGDEVHLRALDANPGIAQTGEIAFDARLAGGDLGAVGDEVIWAGSADDLRLVVRAGEPPPGIPDGSELDGAFSPAMSREGKLAFQAGIIPPGGTEYRGLWSGTPDDPRLVTYSGAPAPGTEPGVTFPASGVLVPNWTVNARGAFAFPAFLEGPGVDGTSNAGIWAGTSDDLGLVMRAGDPAPVPEAGSTFVGRPEYAIINGNDRVLFPAFVTGDGITQVNDRGLWAGSANASPELIIREGDEVPLLGAAYILTGFTSFLLTEDDRVLVSPSFDGPGVTPDNDEAIFLGEPGNWELIFREGEQAPGLPDGVVFDFTGRSKEITIVESGAAGMLLPLGGLGVNETNDEALFWRRSEIDAWVLVAREGEMFDGSVIDDGGLDISVSGGGSGARPSINDRGELGFWIRFEDQLDDSVYGAYVVPGPTPLALLGLGALGAFSRSRRSSV